MSKKRVFSTDDVLKEICMNSDSDNSDQELAESDTDLDYDDLNHDRRSRSRSRSSSSSDTSSEDLDLDAPSASNTRPRTINRGRKRPRGGGRGTARTADTENDRWEEPANGHGSLNNIPVFTKVSEILETFTPRGPTDVLVYFNAFLDDNMFQSMAEETNRYAEQVRAVKPTYVHLSNWKPATATDIKTMIALLLAMGLVDKPDIKSYWSTNPILETPFFSKTMSRNRFLALFAFFHLVNNETQIPRGAPNYDKLNKIRPLFDHLNTRFPQIYYPQQQLAVDESMMPWRGRVEFRQYIPSKPIRYGMKLYFCCESSSGYILNMKFYTGANTTGPERGHGEQVVRDVTTRYQGVGHTIYMDSFFSTPGLYADLLDNRTTACGTIMQNRKGLPREITGKNMKLRKGESVVRQKEGLVALRLKDKKDVMLLSTAHTGRVVETGKRDRLTQEPTRKPDIVHQYNKYMKGVDQIDMYLSFYSFNRKTLKWWKRAATHFIHLARVQAHIIYRKCNPTTSSMSLQQFTIHLIGSLLSDVAEKQTLITIPPTPLGRLSHKDNPHFLESIPPTDKKLRPTKKCIACTVKGNTKDKYIRRKETRFQCKQCKVPLCVEPWHEFYHTHQDYAREIRRYHQSD